MEDTPQDKDTLIIRLSSLTLQDVQGNTRPTVMLINCRSDNWSVVLNSLSNKCRSLSFINCRIDSQQIRSLRTFKLLDTLVLDGNCSLDQLTMLTQLKHLTVVNNPIMNNLADLGGVRRIIDSLPKLQTLSWPLHFMSRLETHRHNLSDRNFRLLADSLIGLQQLKIGGKEISDKTLAEVLPKFTSLTVLELVMRSASSKVIDQIRRMDNLIQLTIHGCDLQDRAAVSLCQSLPQLIELNFGNNPISVVTMQAIVKYLRHLRSLHLLGNPLSPEFIQTLVQGRLPLKQLDVYQCHLNGKALMEICKLTYLTELFISQNAFDDETFRRIATRLPRLITLHASSSFRNRKKEVVAPVQMVLRALPKLREIDSDPTSDSRNKQRLRVLQIKG